MMKKTYKYYIAAIIASVLTSCSSEAPFKDPKQETGIGEFSKYAFKIDVKDNNVISSRAADNEVFNDFIIEFRTNGANSELVEKFKYNEMPDIVTLAAGEYTVTATYGDSQFADFEKPHYLGKSSPFQINANKITTDIGVIECRLENIKVSVVFDPLLASHMEDDSYVEVTVNNGTQSTLRFTTEHASTGKAGFFPHTGECTLSATFNGTVDGVRLTENKVLGNVDKGNHYQINFIRHDYKGEDSESVEGNIKIDASVTVTNLNENVNIEDDKPLDDNERPKEDVIDGGDQPGTEEPGEDPEHPDNPQIPENEYISFKPMEGSSIDLNTVNPVKTGDIVALEVTCPAGIKKFEVSIQNPLRNFLDDILPADFDLADPGESLDSFHTLNLIPLDKTSLKDETQVKFDVTNFIPILCTIDDILGQENKFIITVTDQENHQNTMTLILVPEL